MIDDGGVTQLVQRRMKELGLVPGDLVSRAGLTKSYVSALLKGKVALPGADKRRDLARTLGIRHVDLLIAAGEIAEEEIDPRVDRYPEGSAHARVLAQIERMDEPEVEALIRAAVLLVEFGRGQKDVGERAPVTVVADGDAP